MRQYSWATKACLTVSSCLWDRILTTILGFHQTSPEPKPFLPQSVANDLLSAVLQLPFISEINGAAIV